jgi:hypothetical protein
MQEISTEVKTQTLEKMISDGVINQSLYKYRMDDEDTEKIFTDKTLWFSHPNAFNDPFDCWANIQALDKKKLSNTLVQRNGIDATRAHLIKEGLKKFTHYDLKRGVDTVLNEVGVCCLSLNCGNILMWSHYAHYHQGLCLEFNILQDPNLFCLTLPVKYVDSMPEYYYPVDNDDIIYKIIQPKSTEWKYEEEIRVVKLRSEIEKNGSQAFHFNPNALRKIIFGCKAHKSTIDKYKNFCKKNGFKHVKFTQMRQKKNGSFELEENNI